jgi:hypothetical protein
MKVVLIVALLALVGCGEDRVIVQSNNERVAELERRADLNDQLDAARDTLININTINITNLTNQLNDLEVDLMALILAERDARLAGDNNLAALLAGAVAAQNLINLAVQGQIASINLRMILIGAAITNLQGQINSINSSLDGISTQLAALQADLNLLRTITNGRLDTLRGQVADLQDQINEQGVQVYKCNSPSSQERIFRINGVFYAVMNRVTTGIIEVFADSSPQVVTTPALCTNPGGQVMPPQAGNSCSEPFTFTPATTTVIAPYTTKNVKVVTDVKMALEPLNPALTYQTTDGGAACTFKTSDLIQVQSL